MNEDDFRNCTRYSSVCHANDSECESPHTNSGFSGSASPDDDEDDDDEDNDEDEDEVAEGGVMLMLATGGSGKLM
jgi:hypothetical protein